MAADRARPDQNNNFSLFAVSNADGFTPVTLWADPSTHGLVLSGSISVGAVTNDGTFLSDTQLRATAVPVSVATVPLPTGAATAANQLIGLVPKVYDALTYTATSATVDTYAYYTGGTGGSLVATLTVTFTAADHATLTSVVRT